VRGADAQGLLFFDDMPARFVTSPRLSLIPIGNALRFGESGEAVRQEESRLAFDELRAQIKGTESGFPYIPAASYATESGTPYLKTPGVHLLAKPQVNPENLREFLQGFSP